MIKILKNVRDGDRFQSLYLSTAQKLLVKFNASNIINSSTDDERPKETSDILESLIDNLTNKSNGFGMAFAMGSIRSILKDYCEKETMTDFDRKLIEGFLKDSKNTTKHPDNL